MNRIHGQQARALSVWATLGLAVATVCATACSTDTRSGSDSSLGSTTSLSTDDTSTFVVVGPQGGPFPNGDRRYRLTNDENGTLHWEAQTTVAWLLFSETSGTLASGETTSVIVTLDGDYASTLAVGEYPADIVFRTAGSAPDLFLSFLLIIRAAPGGPELTVTPVEGFSPTGEVGGPIDPAEKTYTLHNTGTSPLDWTASSSRAWVQAAPGSGQLAPGAQIDVTLSLNMGQIAAFDAGIRTALVEFENASGEGDSDRLVTLTLREPNGDEGGRVTEGLIALYDFEEAGGTRVSDVSGFAPDAVLTVADPTRVHWVPGGLSIDSPTILSTSVPPSSLIDECRASNEVTIEGWVKPANLTQEGPARLVTLSDGGSLRNFTLGQGLWGGQPRDTFNVRLRTTATDLDGMPLLTTPSGAATTSLTHVAYTRNRTGTAQLFVNGQNLATMHVGGDFSNWSDSYRLAVGNEIGASRPWLGEVHLVAVYDRALTQGEVDQNFAAGPGNQEFGRIAVVPADDFVIEGRGTQFTAQTKSYTVSNPGNESVQWSASVSDNWVSIEGPSGGNLAPSASASFMLRLDTDMAATFEPGLYRSGLTVSNETNGFGSTERQIELTMTEGGTDDDVGEGEFVSSVTQYGITWTFDREYEVGQYVLGDYWVVGPVRVISVSPSPSNGRHGSMVNPASQAAYGQAYDNRAIGWRAENGVGFPLTLNPGQSLVSTASNSTVPAQDLLDTTVSYGFLRTAAVLTAVSAPQSPTQFRPPLAGTEKPVLDSQDLRWDLLPSLPRASGIPRYMVDGLPADEQYARFFERPWILHGADYHGRQIHPSENMPGYHREVYNVISDASAILISDFPNKERLALGFIQVGIDMYYAGLTGGVDSSYHKWNVLFAGLMLNHSGMKGVTYNARTDWMTYLAQNGTSPINSSSVPDGQGWTGATVLYRQDPGEQEHEHLHPNEWTQVSNGGGIKREAYRRSNSFTWIGACLAARVMDAEGLWDHPAFFDYVDRWMSEPDGDNMNYLESLYGVNLWFQGGSTSSDFVRNMWLQYRGSY